MALSTAVFVGEAKEWIPDLVERARKLKVNAGNLKYVPLHFKDWDLSAWLQNLRVYFVFILILTFEPLL